MLQVLRSPKIYDVCIIGSGAAGGAAAKVLTEGGVSVVMLEAGPPLGPAKDFKEQSLALRSSPPRWGQRQAFAWKTFLAGRNTGRDTDRIAGVSAFVANVINGESAFHQLAIRLTWPHRHSGVASDLFV
jgi:choline dehydrogenase-like flavoprotein